MSDYCKTHKHNDLCRLTNRVVSADFCRLCCRQRPELYKVKSLDYYRRKFRKPLTNEQESDKDVVTVIIPAGLVDEQYVERTIRSIEENAVGPIEILTELDEKKEGHRVLTNRMAKQAKGKYLLRIDAHSSMSEGWDARMKASCGPTTLLSPIIDTLDPETWTGKGRDMGMVVLTKAMENTYPLLWKPLSQRELEEETMSILGCTYMIQKDYYWHHEGCEESLGFWGAGGLEWILKVWLTGGRVLLRTDTVCCHLFREDGKAPFDIDLAKLNKAFLGLGRRWRDGLGKGQTLPLSWLAQKFAKHLKAAVQWAGVGHRYVVPTGKKKEVAHRSPSGSRQDGLKIKGNDVPALSPPGPR